MSTPDPRISAIRRRLDAECGEGRAVFGVLDDRRGPRRGRRQRATRGRAPAGAAATPVASPKSRNRAPSPNRSPPAHPPRRETRGPARGRRTAPASAPRDAECRAAQPGRGGRSRRSPAPHRQRRRRAAARRSGEPEKPSSAIFAPCARTRVATTTSKPSSRAALATGRRCEQKYQSSVTRNSSFGRRRAIAHRTPAASEASDRIVQGHFPVAAKRNEEQAAARLPHCLGPL